MHLDDLGLVLSPTDLTKHLACPHVTTLDLAALRGEAPPPEGTDDALALIFRLGIEHERAHLDRLRTEGREVVEVPDEGVDLATRVRLTDEAVRAGAEVVYQATFLHEGARGHADFLVRADRPSDLGPWSYDVADTKLARRMKVAALLQMADYGRHLERLQGAPPEWLTVVTGDGEQHRFRYADAAAYASRAAARLRAVVEDPPTTSPQPVAHCAQCRWAPRCQDEWRSADHLSLVAFMRSDHRARLEEAGVTTVAGLAASSPDELPATIGHASRVRLQAQAALQVAERRTGRPHHELLDPHPGLGLLRLPEPDPADVYLDFEGDPYAEGGEGREYLAGLWVDGEYRAYWAHSREEERTLTAALLRDLSARLDAHPGMHVYHYAPYERSALQRLTQRHGVGEAELDRLLRGETLVDLYAVVRQGLRISKGSYSIKKLEAFYWGGERGSGDQPDDVADALESVVAYERWLTDRDDGTLQQIAGYNCDDVRSTNLLHEWLERRRSELEEQHGKVFERPGVTPPDLGDEQTEAAARESELAARLEDAGHRLLAGLVGWHRRESRPQWWDHYRTDGLGDEELVADGAALGGLGEPVEAGRVKRSTLWRYDFPPQDTKVDVGQTAYDADTHERVGTVHELRPVEGRLLLKVGNTRPAPTPRGLGPGKPFDVRVLQRSIARTAEAVLNGSSTLGALLVARTVPTVLLTEGAADESPADTAVRVALGLDGDVLAVQGPPGSGKTTTGAAIIRALLDDGKKVGVCAGSHAVVGNLLAAVGRPALQKCTEGDHCGAPGVERADDNATVDDALATGAHRLVGGTAWLWSRGELAGSVDVLVVDEAGQFSLANAVAVAQGARALVLLGDQQQLAQPSQASHPDGAGVSALEHLLDGAATMPPDRGVFLDRSWRMHPDLCAVVSDLMYEGRLEPAPGRELQSLDAPAPWGGAGVRWVPVVHEGNESASTEEADEVARIVGELVGSRWTDHEGVSHVMTLDDVLVVAPYNAHVARLRDALPAGARIGTVDKFQGRQAPVAIYSTASSSVEDAPRGVSFLYDLHRLNVALSRARCVAIVVGSPTLLDAPVARPDDLRAVNGLIATVDRATGQSTSASSSS